MYEEMNVEEKAIMTSSQNESYSREDWKEDSSQDLHQFQKQKGVWLLNADHAVIRSIKYHAALIKDIFKDL